MESTRAYFYRPTSEQEVLLRAAVLPGAAAAHAWRSVRTGLDLARMDPESQRLLPLLYRNLRRQGIEDRSLDRLKGTYRHTWVRNQLLVRQAAHLLRALADGGIPTMVLKGLALTAGSYHDIGLRPMNDLDILVPATMASRAIDVMRQCGWAADHSLTPRFIRTRHAGAFVDRGGLQCDLHWYVFPESRQPSKDSNLWAASVEIEIGGVTTRMLAPTDQLLHLGVHGTAWWEGPLIRWVPDMLLVLENNEVDWGRLASQATNRRFVLRVWHTVSYLRSAFNAPIPDAALTLLAELPVSWIERLDAWGRWRLMRNKRFGKLALDWYAYLNSLERVDVTSLLGFPQYLQDVWDCETFGQFTRMLAIRGMKWLREAKTV